MEKQGFEGVLFLKRNIALIILISAVFAYIIYLYIKYIKRNPRIVKMVKKIPGPKEYPFIGNAFEFAVPNQELISNFERLFRELNTDIFTGWLGNRPYYFIANAEDAEKILSSTVHIEKGFEYSFIESWLGTGLLTSKGKKWQQRRKLLTPSFHFKILEDFFDIFNEQSQILIDILKEKYEEQKNIVNIFPIVTRCALDIICETAMGEKIYAQRDLDSAYVKAIYKNSELFISRITRPWLRNDLIWKMSLKERTEKKALKILHTFTENVIKQRKQERKEDLSKGYNDNSRPRKRRLAFLDLLLDTSCDGKVLSDLDIREETDTFMFEGHDTTAASMNWTIFLLACNPEHQVKVRQEVNQVFDQTENGVLKHGDISKLRYLESCIKEALRLYPSVPFMARHLSQDCDMGNSIELPAGSEVLICTFFLHRNPKYFVNPLSFQPERFLLENSKNRNPYAYIPFSAGPRNCIGQKFALMEEKVVLANLFKNFWFEPMENIDDIKLVPDVVLRPVNGLHVKFTLAKDK